MIYIFWLVTMLVSAVSAASHTGITDDTNIDYDAWKDKATDYNILRTAAGKSLYHSLDKPSQIDTPSFGDLRNLIEAVGSGASNLDVRTLFPEKRTYNELNTISGMLEANAEKLDYLTKYMERRQSHTESLFISLFLMLADLSLATSPRQKRPPKDMSKIFNFFRDNIETDINGKTLDNSFSPIYQWYTGSAAGLRRYTSCLDYLNAGYTKNGVYMILIPNTIEELDVYCDQTTDNGGWLVFQRRQDGSVDFYRDWAQYKNGFGEVSGEFWLGNDHLHLLTKQAQELRVDLTDFSGSTAYAKYETFNVGRETEKYRLSVSGYSGTAGDSLDYVNEMSFSTKDRDNDEYSASCTKVRKGAWWYKNCAHLNLNGMYYNSARVDTTGVTWYYWKNRYETLKKVEMKIRPKQ